MSAPPGLLALQSAVGNAAVVQMLSQAGRDRAPEAQQHGDGRGHASTAQPAVQRSAVHDVLRTPGRPLDEATRADMESRLGADFSDVRIHTDGAAKASAAEVGARAYTSGSHVVVGEDGADKQTLAHELTHVIQQRRGPVSGADNGAGLRVSDPSDRFERDAEANARRVMSRPAPHSGLSDAGAPPAPAGGAAAASSAPVQRVFQGDLSGYGTAQAVAALKEQVPGSKPKWSEVDKARTGAPAYASVGDLASALGLQQPQQSGEASATGVVPTSTAPASTTPASTTPASTTASRPPRPAPKPKPKPAGLTMSGQQSSSSAAQEQLPSTATAASHTRTTTPPVPVEEREKGVAEQVSWGEFAENSKQARDELAKERATPRMYLRRRAASRLDDAVFQQMAGSVKINNKSQVMPHLIDQLYSCLEWTGRSPIAVFTHEAQGKGDLMLGVKTADALRENFPRTEANKNDISLLTAKAAHNKQPGVFADSGHPFTVLDGATPNAPHLDPGQGPTHAIVAPQLAATKNFQKSVGHWGSTVSAMTEYSKKEPLPPGAGGTGYTTGLGAGEVGITFDAGLRAYKQNQDSIEGEENKRAARLENLQALKSKDLLTALFPEDQEQKAKEYAAAATSRLYFAYSNKSAMRFALTVAEVENGNGNDVHVVQSSPTQMPALDATVKRDLAALGVAKVRLVEVSSQKPAPTITVEDTGGAGKTMHWITTDRVPHDDMLTLIKASEPIVMTTGNQSTSEALSAGKTILYESIGMEQSKTFRQSLYAGAGVKQPDIDSITAVSRDYDQRGTPGPAQPQFKAAAAALRNMQQEGRMGAFSDRASATKDLGRWIGGQHLRDFLMKTDLASELRSREEKLTSDYRKAEAYRSFVDHLLGLPAGEE
ncbi:eCIS core domain-containing protein [Streptomyces subrutilus]|uniref:eCIS core domain-containing protein n=1 Tax=Streptomyces subrutilus TaxID=36818 RepID=UPI0033F02DB4